MTQIMETSREMTSEVMLDRRNAHALARGLGWFSLGLGAAEVLAPKALSRWLGMKDGAALLQSYGAREILAGIGILASSNPTPFVWSRLGGDAVDLATLAAGIREDNPNNGNIGIALAAVFGATLADAVCAGSLQQHDDEDRQRRRRHIAAYKRRSGFRQPAAAMKGAARDFEVPEDMRTPEALRPYAS